MNKTSKMNCLICKHGETRPGKTAVTLEREATTVWSLKVFPLKSVQTVARSM